MRELQKSCLTWGKRLWNAVTNAMGLREHAVVMGKVNAGGYGIFLSIVSTR